jgi:urease accessory protein
VALLVSLLAAGQAIAHVGHDHGGGSWFDWLPPPDSVLAMAGLGAFLGRLESDRRQAPIGTVVLAYCAGIVLGAELLPAWPVMRAPSLLLTGLLLVEPGNWTGRAALPLAGTAALLAGLVCGANLGFVPAFPIIAGFASIFGALSAAAALSGWRFFYRPWFRIAIRIAGSWMAAIGIILLGAAFR